MTGITKSGLDPKNFFDIVDGKPVALFVLTNNNGMEACITNYGGRIVSLMVPDRDGKLTDVELGHDSIANYLADDGNFGALIGRYGNRIGYGKFTIDGVEYNLPINNGPHCLHGGMKGYDKKVWDAKQDGNRLELTLVDPDGNEATTDKPTIINLTNHSYFNLNGDLASSIHNHVLTIDADRITPADETLITDGSFMDVAGTPFDFSTPKPIGQDINADNEQLKNGNGYDHSFALNHPGDLSKVALRVMSPVTGIAMEVFTTEPAVQIYTGNFLDENLKGKFGVGYPARSAVAFETQHYPNTPNCPEYPSCELRPGDTYFTRTIYRFTTA